MKTAIVFADGIKQIIFTAENDDELRALNFLKPNNDEIIEVAVHSGSFADTKDRIYTPSISKCRGGYLRVFNNDSSIMFVISAKKIKTEAEQ